MSSSDRRRPGSTRTGRAELGHKSEPVATSAPAATSSRPAPRPASARSVTVAPRDPKTGSPATSARRTATGPTAPPPTSAAEASYRRVVEAGRPARRRPPLRRRDWLIWAPGFLAGVQAAALSLVCVVVPAIGAFSATSTAAVNIGVSWVDAARVGADLWLLGHGGSLTLGPGQGAAAEVGGGPSLTVTIPALGIALLSVLCSRFLARHTSSRRWWLIAGGPLGFVATTALVAYVMATPSARSTAPYAIVGALVASLVGTAWGNAPANRILIPAASRWLVKQAPPVLRLIPRAAGASAGGVMALAGGIVLLWTLARYDAFLTVFDLLGVGVVDGVALALLCAAYVPNLLVLALGYLTGAGFWVGAETLYSPSGTLGGPLPSLPLLAVLPADAPPPGTAAVLLAPVVVGVITGWWLQRRADEADWWQLALAGLAVSGLVGIGAGGVVWFASGAAGPGRLAHVGGDPLLTGGVLTALLALGLVTTAIARWWWFRRGRSPLPQAAPQPPPIGQIEAAGHSRMAADDDEVLG